MPYLLPCALIRSELLCPLGQQSMSTNPSNHTNVLKQTCYAKETHTHTLSRGDEPRVKFLKNLNECDRLFYVNVAIIKGQLSLNLWGLSSPFSINNPGAENPPKPLCWSLAVIPPPHALLSRFPGHNSVQPSHENPVLSSFDVGCCFYSPWLEGDLVQSNSSHFLLPPHFFSSNGLMELLQAFYPS